MENLWLRTTGWSEQYRTVSLGWTFNATRYYYPNGSLYLFNQQLKEDKKDDKDAFFQ